MDKIKIADAFSKAANSYDQAATVQRTIGTWLLQQIEPQDRKTILDLGCGTGYFTNKLCNLFSKAKVYGIDFAVNMVTYAHTKYINNNLDFLHADIENIPFTDDSINLAFSNCVLQWVPNITNTLNEIRRVLCKNGQLFFSTFVQGTLQELQQTNSFQTIEQIQIELINSGFTNINLVTKNIVLEFDNIKELMCYLKKLGTNYVANRKTGLMGKKAFAALNDLGKITATFVVVYGNAIGG